MRQSVKKRFLEILAIDLVIGSVVRAHQAPATGYELSIYEATPISVWVGLGAALIVSIVLIAILDSKIGYVSGLLALISWASMGPIRGHLSGADTLVHLGEVKYIIATEKLRNGFYPVTHLLSTNLSSIGGLSPRQSLILTTPIFVALFVIFITLTVRRFADRGLYGSPVGFFTGLLLLPINWMGVQLKPHPSSYATLLVPLLLFTALLYWEYGNASRLGCFAILSLALVHTHPLIALVTTGILAAVSFSNLTLDKVSKNINFDIIERWWLYSLPVLILGVFVSVKLSGNSTFQSEIAAVTKNFGLLFTQESTTTGRASSLNDVGITPTQLVVRLMGVSLFAGVVGAITAIVSIYKSISNRNASNRLQIILFIGTLSSIVPFLVFFFADSLLYFRIFGLSMIFVSIVFASGVSWVLLGATDRKFINSSYLLVIVFLILLTPSMAIAHPSPYIVQESQQRTEAQLAAVDTLSTHSDGNDVVTVRSHYPRLKWAVTGRPAILHIQTTPYGFNNRNLPAAYNQSRYVLVTERDYQMDVRLYDGFRYNSGDFAYLDNETGMNKILNNGGTTIYRIPDESQQRRSVRCEDCQSHAGASD
ncbi:hypothetical protein [Haloarcula nitratireducens]|uniref:Glycosyltransferase RgtA/B/C/D-like domain-containing protein n=1 Tax=Haloarcula nitratireducens TaxID=2487749 RepID=A0AAW4PKD1_9EURY|nr:hypothetical protein [Halomicroarcula nitratireducens]MBX0297755.1 hypothetical protein [Halomicroarcula nitratireducens]